MRVSTPSLVSPRCVPCRQKATVIRRLMISNSPGRTLSILLERQAGHDHCFPRPGCPQSTGAQRTGTSR